MHFAVDNEGGELYVKLFVDFLGIMGLLSDV